MLSEYAFTEKFVTCRSRLEGWAKKRECSFCSMTFPQVCGSPTRQELCAFEGNWRDNADWVPSTVFSLSQACGVQHSKLVQVECRIHSQFC